MEGASSSADRHGVRKCANCGEEPPSGIKMGFGAGGNRNCMMTCAQYWRRNKKLRPVPANAPYGAANANALAQIGGAGTGSEGGGGPVEEPKYRSVFQGKPRASGETPYDVQFSDNCGKTVIGCYKTNEDGARAYDRVAVRVFEVKKP